MVPLALTEVFIELRVGNPRRTHLEIDKSGLVAKYLVVPPPTHDKGMGYEVNPGYCARYVRVHPIDLVSPPSLRGVMEGSGVYRPLTS